MTTSHPAAESFARSISLPVTVCPVTKELYGYAAPVFDAPSAQKTLARAGFLVGTPAHEAAMAVLLGRFETYTFNGR